MSMNDVFTDMVQRNHREYVRRENLRKANRLVSIKETILGFLIMLMILLASGIAGGIEMGTILLPF